MVSYGTKKSRNASRISKSCQYITKFPQTQRSLCTMTCRVLTCFRILELMNLAKDKSKGNTGIFPEVMKSMSTGDLVP